jgi:SpoIID/LytB domain protein
MLVVGTYPTVTSQCVDTTQPLLRARYAGAIEVGRDSDGSLFVVGELPFEEYLKGIAEVPRTWPMAALKAQVVAARTYALAHLSYPDPTGDRLGYDLCASDQCQVYRGWGISHGPDGDRWSRAVSQTAGQALLSNGRPADALYFSTSPGYTIGNEKVFGGSPLPYLRPVVERDDGASPLSLWHVSIPKSDVGRFLRAGGDWGSATVTSVRRDGADVVVQGGGASTRLPVADFRSDLNTWGPCLSPSRYPGEDSDGTSLPQTVPSVWFDMSNAGSRVSMDGRGWGHGVGMVQWGAYGKAERGVSYRDILADYYGGLRPKSFDEPTTIRVGIATGLKSVTIAPTGPVSLRGAGPAEGPWLIKGGRALHVREGTQPKARIDPGTLVEAPRTARTGHPFAVTVDVPQRSVVSVVATLDGSDTTLIRPRTLDVGTWTIRGTVPELPSGTADVRAVVTDGIDIVSTAPASVVVHGVAPPSQPPSTAAPTSAGPPPAAAAEGGSGVPPWAVALAAAAAGAVGAAALAWRRARRTPRL